MKLKKNLKYVIILSLREREKGYYTKTEKYFDKYTGYYFIRVDYYLDVNPRCIPIGTSYRYFVTFAEFAKYLDNYISDCDISCDLSLKIKIDEYRYNENTKLPINLYTNLKKKIIKRYNRNTSEFEVYIRWYDECETHVYTHKRTFMLFEDFLVFLKNDLSKL